MVAQGAEKKPDAVALMLGERERHEVASGGFAVALGLHIALLAFAIVTSLLAQMKSAMAEERMKLHDFFWRVYDVEVEKPKDPPKKEEEPPPEPPPPPPPEPAAPAPKAQAKPVEDDPYKNLPPPTPAKAGRVLVAEPKADDPVELPTIVNGDGTVNGGMQAADGRGDRITKNVNATNNGTPNGKGTAPPAPAAAPPTEDRSRPISLVGGAWRCPFPPEADADQIDRAVVGVQVTVRPDGSPASVTVLNDPGHGFGRAAKNCAMSSRFNPAFDKSGAPVLQSAPVNITFRR